LTALARADKRGKKERFVVLNKTAHLKMLPEFYLNCLNSQLSTLSISIAYLRNAGVAVAIS
jgi:hypothetical protein